MKITIYKTASGVLVVRGDSSWVEFERNLENTHSFNTTTAALRHIKSVLNKWNEPTRLPATVPRRNP